MPSGGGPPLRTSPKSTRGSGRSSGLLWFRWISSPLAVTFVGEGSTASSRNGLPSDGTPRSAGGGASSSVAVSVPVAVSVDSVAGWSRGGAAAGSSVAPQALRTKMPAAASGSGRNIGGKPAARGRSSGSDPIAGGLDVFARCFGTPTMRNGGRGVACSPNVFSGPFALALTAGMAATVNPCGFALLPAYLSAFIGLDDDDAGGTRRPRSARRSRSRPCSPPASSRSSGSSAP